MPIRRGRRRWQEVQVNSTRFRTSVRNSRRRASFISKTYTCEVRAFVQIAALASQRQITFIIGAAVYSGRDVFDMMPQAAMFLMQTTIFATVASPLPDKGPRRGIHLLLNIRVQV